MFDAANEKRVRKLADAKPPPVDSPEIPRTPQPPSIIVAFLDTTTLGDSGSLKPLSLDREEKFHFAASYRHPVTIQFFPSNLRNLLSNSFASD